MPKRSKTKPTPAVNSVQSKSAPLPKSRKRKNEARSLRLENLQHDDDIKQQQTQKNCKKTNPRY